VEYIRVRSEDEGISCTQVILKGDPANELARYLKRFQCGYLVDGEHWTHRN
jgi:hypothetical protein